MSKLRQDPLGWETAMNEASDTYWNARRDGHNEGDALWRAVDAVVGLCERWADELPEGK